MSAPLVEMRDISKTFGAVVALRHVSLTLGQGEVLGLVGDNAAGKSTLMKILSGAYTPDAGEILIDGTRVAFEGPMAARAAGIEMVYQDFALVPELTVTQNIFLGREIVRRRLGVGILDRKAMDGRALDLLQRLGLRVPSAASAVRELSGGQQQAVAIARATGFEAKLVIMDEPTANLGASAIDKVRETIARLKAQGVAVIIISHRIEDVFAVGDRVMVLRHGHVVGSRQVSDIATDELVQMIVTGQDPRERAANDR
jgi:simple sugar transport system ATP-binding protein